jgi:hypothetical protein
MHLFPTFVLAACASAALAQPHEGDIILNTATGTIQTGSLNATTFQERRIFVAELGFIAPFFTSDPGFDNLPGTFAVGSRVGFTVRDALRKWTGTDFNEVGPERLEIARSTLVTNTPMTPATVPGFTLATGTNGQWHRHYEYTLFAPAPHVPRDGVYLLQMSLWTNTGSPAESQPFYILFDNNAQPSDVLAAQQFVESVINPPAGCDDIDFNNNEVFPEDQDVIDFFGVLAGADCPACNDIDFNNNGVFPEDQDVIDFFTVLAGGTC